MSSQTGSDQLAHAVVHILRRCSERRSVRPILAPTDQECRPQAARYHRQTTCTLGPACHDVCGTEQLANHAVLYSNLRTRVWYRRISEQRRQAGAEMLRYAERQSDNEDSTGLAHAQLYRPFDKGKLLFLALGMRCIA